jgi:hypothetical protein
MSEKANFNIQEFVQLFNQRKTLDENDLSKLVEEYDLLKKQMTPIKKKINKNKPDDQKKKKKEKSLNKVINADKLQNELIKIANKLNSLAGQSDESDESE